MIVRPAQPASIWVAPQDESESEEEDDKLEEKEIANISASMSSASNIKDKEFEQWCKVQIKRYGALPVSYGVDSSETAI